VPRNLSSEVIEQLSARVVRSGWLLSCDISNIAMRYWTGAHNISWDGKTYVGNSRIITKSSIRDSIGPNANGVTVELTGLSSELIALILQDSKQSAVGKIWRAFFTEGWNLIDADLRFQGTIDRITIPEEPTTSRVIIDFESGLTRFRRPPDVRYSNEYQRSRYPSDRGFQFVSQLQSQRIMWGRSDPGRIRI
jgi:hypothetical protein